MSVIFKKVILSAVLLMFSGASYSALMSYTFEGSVTSTSDAAGIIGGDITGDLVSYVFLIDSGASGSFTRYNNTTSEKTDTSSRDYFYSKFISGSLIESNPPGCCYSSNTDVKSFNYGWSTSDYTKVLGDSQSDLTYVKTTDTLALSVDSWYVGLDFTGYERAYIKDSSGSNVNSQIYSDLTLVSISPVPVPAAVWLFGTALLGFVGFSRRTAVT